MARNLFTSATPMSDRLAQFVDNHRRGSPHLSLSERNQIRAEESGETGKRDLNVKNIEQVRILMKALRGVYADDELTKRDREEILGEVFSDYRVRTGRDGLADIADYSAPRPPPETALKSAAYHVELANAYLQGKAAELRKSDPRLTEAQAFAKAYSDPANRDIANAERAASYARFAELADAQNGESSIQKRLLVATRDRALDAIGMRAAELRRERPELSEAQAFAKVYSDPSNRELAKAERSAARAAIGA
jgi:hypothetical protein